MSVFGSLFTAVSGLSAQSQSMGMISNNIANVNTVGYKRTDAAFSSLVTTEGRSTIFSPGSVRTVQNARIDQQGILQQSSSSTDIAISGNGFFVVQRTTDTGSEPLYTRAGSFSEDATGVLQNTSGFYLMGWPLDQDGQLPASQADISSLVPVDVAFLGGLTQPTTQAHLAVNLDANETQSSYPLSTSWSPDFTRGLRVYDSLGESQDMTINFKKIVTPTALSVGTIDISGITGNMDQTPPFAPGDSFDITVGGVGPTTIPLNVDRGQFLSSLNAIVDINNNPMLFAQIDDNGYLSIKARNNGDSITLAENTGTPLATGFGIVPGVFASPAALDLLTPLAETPNTEGWWQVQFVSPLGTTMEEGLINLTGTGLLNATPDLDGDVDVALTGINWGNGSDLQDVDFNIASFTQFAGEYNVITSRQNGAELGLRTGVSIDREGFVTAQFSNGKNSRIFKLAMATFANANGLDELTGNVFRESDSSGSFNLREAGTGGAGQIEGAALEGSNVDLADEFAKMIVTQRAYSANTKVIQTADDMTSELLRLR